MKLLKNEKIINILEKSLNFVDARLMDHGKRVAYRVYRMLEPQNKYDEKMLRDICVLAMLHDIGAYKTEEIDKMAVFEELVVWEHSVYGYLFLKYFSPLKDLSQAILFHHANCAEIVYADPFIQELAQLIFICDRADIFSLAEHGPNAFQKHIENARGKQFRSDIIDMFLSADTNLVSIADCINCDEKFNRILYETPLSGEEVDKYLEMVIFSIDFRSHQTVFHTITTTGISACLGRLMGMNEEEIEIIKTGAMLHDIGKIGIPISILESPNRLTPEEFAIMKTHVEVGEKIIKGSVHEEIISIAGHHHEKINGTGYPKKLGASELSRSDRIVAVADIFSALCSKRTYKEEFPKETITKILTEMVQEGLVDPEIASLSITHTDEILDDIQKISAPVLEAYDTLNNDYKHILDCINRSDFKTIALV